MSEIFESEGFCFLMLEMWFDRKSRLFYNFSTSILSKILTYFRLQRPYSQFTPKGLWKIVAKFSIVTHMNVISDNHQNQNSEAQVKTWEDQIF